MALQVGGDGDLLEGLVGAVHLDGIAGQGGEVVEQAAEVVDGPSLRRAAGLGLGGGAGRRCGPGHRGALAPGGVARVGMRDAVSIQLVTTNVRAPYRPPQDHALTVQQLTVNRPSKPTQNFGITGAVSLTLAMLTIKLSIAFSIGVFPRLVVLVSELDASVPVEHSRVAATGCFLLDITARFVSEKMAQAAVA